MGGEPKRDEVMGPTSHKDKEQHRMGMELAQPFLVFQLLRGLILHIHTFLLVLVMALASCDLNQDPHALFPSLPP